MSSNEKKTDVITSASPLAGQSETNLKAGSLATSNSTSTGRATATASGTSRLEKVSAKDLCDFKNGHQLVSVMHDAILAHQRLYEDGGIMHGDINPNTIVILETEDGKVEGALIDYDMPLCRAAMRKLRKPDPVVPPPRASQWAQGYQLPAYFRRGPGI